LGFAVARGSNTRRDKPAKLNSPLAAVSFGGSLGNLATQCHLFDVEPHLILGTTKFPKPHFDCLDRRHWFYLVECIVIVLFHNELIFGVKRVQGRSKRESATSG